MCIFTALKSLFSVNGLSSAASIITKIDSLMDEFMDHRMAEGSSKDAAIDLIIQILQSEKTKK